MEGLMSAGSWLSDEVQGDGETPSNTAHRERERESEVGMQINRKTTDKMEEKKKSDGRRHMVD